MLILANCFSTFCFDEVNHYQALVNTYYLYMDQLDINSMCLLALDSGLL
jgi:hypothetical protein